MSDSYGPRPPGGFRDLVPWGDPYIVALIEKLRRTDEFERASEREAASELPPPLDSDNPPGDDRWPTDWPPRRWPRR